MSEIEVSKKETIANNKNDLLPVLLDEVVLEKDDFLLKKIARFKCGQDVWVYEDEWILRTENGRYSIFDRGRQMKEFSFDRSAEDEEDEIEDKLLEEKYASMYFSVQPIGNGTFIVTEKSKDLDIVKLIDGNNNTLSEHYHHIYGHKAPFATKRWVNGERRCGLIDETGKIIIEGPFEISATRFPVYSERKRRLVIHVANKFGVIDYDGNVIIYPKYKEILSISSDLMVGRLMNNKSVLLSEGGEELLCADYIQVWDNQAVAENDKQGVEIYEFIKKKDDEVCRQKIEALCREIKKDNEFDIRALSMERLHNLTSRMMRMHLVDKMMSKETMDRLLSVMPDKTWEEKKLLADQLIEILDTSFSEEEILEKLREMQK